MDFAFAGSPDFAAWVLSDLAGVGRLPSLVISQPDRPRGRGRKVGAPPAALEAARLGIECLQTDDINLPLVAEHIRKRGIQTLVVAAFKVTAGAEGFAVGITGKLIAVIVLLAALWVLSVKVMQREETAQPCRSAHSLAERRVRCCGQLGSSELG